MRTIGFLPISQKNKLSKRKFLGRPLFCWVLAEAIFSELEEIFVATDDDEIQHFISKNYNWTKKINVISFDSKTNSVEAFNSFKTEKSKTGDIVCLLNIFSAFVSKADINRGLSKVSDQKTTHAISVVELENKIRNEDGSITMGVQNSRFLENSALLFEKIGGENLKTSELIKMPVETIFPISEKNWESNETIIANKLISEKETKSIKFLVLDVDGVFTDGGVYYDENGELSKRFDIRDGMGLEILREHGVQVAVMTSEDSALVKKRMEKLKIEHVFLYAKDKHSLLQNFLEQQNISRGEIAYIGDDVNDLANLCSVGWSFCPQNATNSVKPFVDIILSQNSGNGAIREATERILNYNKRF
ncbi:MAG TPA: N-acylneuraminate cytidylyltransferase [Salinimicrobium sp.]|nr:N-acylneuraminate cytidylyltransferase [Salinimicrobium sp.]